MSYEREEHLFSIGWLDHSPIIPARKGHSEAVYATGWATFMGILPDSSSPPNAALANILSLCEPLTQRHASVAASFMTWLGTSCGLAFLDECKRGADAVPESLYSRHAHQKRVFLGQWAWTNRRLIHVNGGYRSIEHILAPADHFGRVGLHGLMALVRGPDLSAEDYETVDQLVMWLAGDAGRKFLAVCDIEVEERRQEDFLRRRLKSSRGEA